MQITKLPGADGGAFSASRRLFYGITAEGEWDCMILLPTALQSELLRRGAEDRPFAPCRLQSGRFFSPSGICFDGNSTGIALTGADPVETAKKLCMLTGSKAAVIKDCKSGALYFAEIKEDGRCDCEKDRV